MISLIKSFLYWLLGTEVRAETLILKPEEYDASYFDGAAFTENVNEKQTSGSSNAHPAGYSRYRRWWRNGSEKFYDIAKNERVRFNLTNKKVLELGCAKGFLVKDLREMGVDAYGLDISQYAVDNAEEEAKPFLTVGDARTDLDQYKNKEFELIFAMGLLTCLTDNDAIQVANDCEQKAKYVAFIVYENANPDYYNVKTLSEWAQLLPSKITLIGKESGEIITT